MVVMRRRELSLLTGGLVAAGFVLSVLACGTILGVDKLTEVACVDPCLDGGNGSEVAPGSGGDGHVQDVVTSEISIIDASDASAIATDGPEDAPEDAMPDHQGGDSASDGGPVCIQDLSNVGQADFRISFVVNTTVIANYVALVNQRAICGGGMYWDIRINNGFLKYESQDNGASPFFSINSSMRVTDGVAHAVVITRKAGTLAITVDGAFDGFEDAGASSSFAQLPPLDVGTDPCEGDGGGKDGTLPFVGSLTKLCISSP
jgi:hypothetical protein